MANTLMFADGYAAPTKAVAKKPKPKPAPKKQSQLVSNTVKGDGYYKPPAQKKPAPPPPRQPQPVRAPAPVKPPPPPRPPAGSTAGGTVTKTQKTPPPISPNAWLAQDSAWLEQDAAYKKALKDYQAQYEAELSKYGNEYNSAVDKVGLERGQGLSDLENDYASRGMLQSGVYGEAMNKYNQDMDTRLSDLSRAKQAYEGDLATGKSNFEEEQGLFLAKAKQDALNRRLDSIKL